MIAVLYVAEVLLVVAALPLMLWLRREGDESWRRHRAMVLAAPITQAWVEFKFVIRDQLTPSLQRVAEAAEQLAEAFQMPTAWRTAVSAELARLTLGGRPERPELVVTTTPPSETEDVRRHP